IHGADIPPPYVGGYGLPCTEYVSKFYLFPHAFPVAHAKELGLLGIEPVRVEQQPLNIRRERWLGQEFRQIVDEMRAALRPDPLDFCLLGQLEKNRSAR